MGQSSLQVTLLSRNRDMGFLKRIFSGKEENAEQEGVSTAKPRDVTVYEELESGLEYCDLKLGTGATPSKGKVVTVHYSGWLTSGKRFDSSVVKNKPFSFPIGRRRVIKGWDEGVMSMKVGGVRQLKIPASLGYGAAGHPPVIPKNATLVFEVELLEVK
jgi:FKBP-type peptidyl-prolyl cis-trans isomerase